MLQECFNFEIKLATKHIFFALCIDLAFNPKMNLNPWQTASSLISAQLLSGTILECCSGLPYAQTKGLYHFGKTTYKCTRIDGITSQIGLEQLIHEPTHINGEKIFLHRFNFCFSTKFGCEIRFSIFFTSSLHQNCHHWIVFARFNVKVVFPPSNERELWHFKKQMLIMLEKQPISVTSRKNLRKTFWAWVLSTFLNNCKILSICIILHNFSQFFSAA